MQSNSGKRKVRKGVVVSDKMDKTILVSVERKYSHPVYKKVVRDKHNFKVHDPKNEAITGDIVQIMETRPLSKQKRWCLSSFLRKAERENFNAPETKEQPSEASGEKEV